MATNTSTAAKEPASADDTTNTIGSVGIGSIGIELTITYVVVYEEE